MKEYNILGVHITKRTKKVNNVQKILTKYGCNIKVRIGLHDVHEDYCALNGVIILQIHGGKKISKQIKEELLSIEGVEVKTMDFK